MCQSVYTSGEYAEKHPNWHAEDSNWKARQVLRLLDRNHLRCKTICEVGCGAGEILKQLQAYMGSECKFWGYEVSPQAFELCSRRANERLHFMLRDIRQDHDASFDLLLIIDLLEHLEDYFSFLRDIRSKSVYKIFHIPLELSAQAISRSDVFVGLRATYGHIHYFTKETALSVLEEAGYEVLDFFYTAGSIERPAKSRQAYLARPLRRLLFSIHKDLAARLLGGFSLAVLAK
jgi:methyltransferase family protein